MYPDMFGTMRNSFRIAVNLAGRATWRPQL